LAARDFSKTGNNTSGHAYSLALHASIEPSSVWLDQKQGAQPFNRNLN